MALALIIPIDSPGFPIDSCGFGLQQPPGILEFSGIPIKEGPLSFPFFSDPGVDMHDKGLVWGPQTFPNSPGPDNSY